jgi:ribonuclease Z
MSSCLGEGRAPVPLELVPSAEGRVLDVGEYTIDCFCVRHHRDTDSFAFSFESQARRHLLPDRLAGLDVPDGPLRGDAEGRPVVLADGRNIDPEDVLGPPEGRKKLLVVGDTETTDGLTCLMIRPCTFRAMMAVWQ